MNWKKKYAERGKIIDRYDKKYGYGHIRLAWGSFLIFFYLIIFLSAMGNILWVGSLILPLALTSILMFNRGYRLEKDIGYKLKAIDKKYKKVNE